MGVMSWCSNVCYQFLNQNLNSFIETYVDPSQSREFHRQCLNFQRTFQKSFMKSISSEQTQEEMNGFVREMDHQTYFLCAKFCSEQILDIILDFPESFPTIRSLNECIEKSDLVRSLLLS